MPLPPPRFSAVARLASAELRKTDETGRPWRAAGLTGSVRKAEEWLPKMSMS